ncbi:MAG: hypothetical protein AB7T63_04965 [Planctomycetota bacterium]
MRRVLLLTVAACVMAACGERPLGGPDMDLRLTLDPDVVAPGVPFEVVVERTWPEGTGPSSFEASDLTPLVARVVNVSREEAHGRIRETRRFEAQALALDDLRVPAATLRVAQPGGGVLRAVRGDVLDVRVATRVDPRDLDVEGPPAPLAEPARRLPWALPAGLGALLALLVVALMLRRRRSVIDDALPTGPDPSPSAPTWSAHLAALGPAHPSDASTRASQVVAASDVFRAALGAARGVDARTLATNRLLRGLEEALGDRAASDTMARAGALVGLADRVKYGAHRPGPTSTEVALATTAHLVGLLHPEAP